MAKKQKTITDAEGNTYVEAKPFYKKWWVWVIAAVVLLFIIPAIVGGGNDNKTTTTTSTKSAKGSSTKKTTTKKTDVQTIDFDNATRDITSQSIHKVDFKDTSWAGTTVTINQAKLIKVKAFKDDGDNKTYQGIVGVHFTITAARDISIYPSQGTLITSDGQQSDADGYDSDDFDGDLGKGVTKDGTVYFELPKLNDPKSIKSLRLKWSANYDTDNMDDNGQYKDYDVTINLN